MRGEKMDRGPVVLLDSKYQNRKSDKSSMCRPKWVKFLEFPTEAEIQNSNVCIFTPFANVEIQKASLQNNFLLNPLICRL